MTDAVKLSLVYADILRARMGAPLKKVFLYGSQARGDANEGSDYDVFVPVDRRTSEIRETVIDAGVEMMNRYDKLFAAIIYGEEEWRKGHRCCGIFSRKESNCERLQADFGTPGRGYIFSPPI